MVFSSVSFLFLFLPVIFVLYLLIRNTLARNILLTVFSLLFYAWGEPVYVLLMIVSVFMNYLFGLFIGKFQSKKTFFLALAIIFNIGILFYFKYCEFFVEILNLLPFANFTVPEIRLPIGISFFTFQALSYVFDVKRGEVKVQKNFLNLLLYISLFPQLIAGPIVKYHDIEMQINQREMTINKTADGLRRFILGLSKKVLIANNVAVMADYLFSVNTSDLNIFSAWVGAIAYTLQIYFDFSGYSDMAIGLGKMFGFDFKENFNYPLSAVGIKDFWRKWHISLSTWFKEYLYIPLGGNRKGKARTYLNQFIVFFTTGLWHGANFTFIVWGLLHGLFLVLETIGVLKPQKFKFFKHIYTLLIVVTLFVIFRANDIGHAFSYLGAMFTGFNFDTANFAIALQYLNVYTLIIIGIAFIASFGILKSFKSRINANTALINVCEVSSYIITAFLFILNILILSGNAYNPFIYFRF